MSSVNSWLHLICFEINNVSFRIGDFSTKKFAERLETLGLGKGNFTEFNSFGKFTFFLPIDSAFEVILS